ncbi:MAG: SH3 domain-containing protein [Clostridia bacterium]|nr:SH3 domain-containing protein [Clostridia bacterium]
MRVAPEKKAGLIMQIPSGTVVDVIENSAGWSKIRYKGFTGYVMS